MNKIYILILCFLGLTQASSADYWDFLPGEPLFAPLIGDLQEPQYSIVARPDQNHFDGAIGQTVEFIQWQPNEATKWSWGIEGSALLQLAATGPATYPLVVSDWCVGTYFTEKSGNFSNRLEYKHVSSHLGDSLIYTVPRIIYSRESFKLTSSYDFSPNFRLYGGPCYWSHLSPDSSDPRLYFHGGLEVYTDYIPLFSATHGRCYLSYDIKVLGEAGGVVDQTLEIGVQWRWKKDSHQSIRMAGVLYNGNSEYGQFYQNQDNFWGLGIFFDP
jgi:hypothetical protein